MNKKRVYKHCNVCNELPNNLKIMVLSGVGNTGNNIKRAELIVLQVEEELKK